MDRKVEFDDCRLQMEKPLSGINLSEDSDGDSDQRQLFELPKRKIHRPSTSSFKKRIGGSKTTCCGRTGLCCRVCFSTLVPIFVTTFVAFTIISFIVLTMGMSGLNKEIQGLKIKISYAEDAEKDFNAKRDKLRKDFENKLQQLSQERKEITTFKNQIDKLNIQIKSINSSLQKLRRHPSFDITSVKSDLDKLKTGMADTGSSISKLENNHNSLVKKVDGIEAESTRLAEDVYNMTVRMAILENKPLPEPRATTAQRLVFTLTPNEDTPVKMKEFKRAIQDLETKQRDVCDLKSKILIDGLEALKNHTDTLNQTYYAKFSMLARQIQAKKVQAKNLLNTAITTNAPSTTISTDGEKQTSEISISKKFHRENTRDTLHKRDLQRNIYRRSAPRYRNWNRDNEDDEYYFVKEEK